MTKAEVSQGSLRKSRLNRADGWVEERKYFPGRRSNMYKGPVVGGVCDGGVTYLPELLFLYICKEGL